MLSLRDVHGCSRSCAAPGDSLKGSTGFCAMTSVQVSVSLASHRVAAGQPFGNMSFAFSHPNAPVIEKGGPMSLAAGSIGYLVPLAIWKCRKPSGQINIGGAATSMPWRGKDGWMANHD